MEKLEGVWKIESSEKFDDYLKAIGVGLIMRKAGQTMKPELTMKFEGKAVMIKSESTFKTFVINGNLDEEFDENTADGRKTKSLLTMEEGKLVHVQKWEGRETKIVRYVAEDGKLHIDLYIDDIVSKRIYVKKA